jgi:hypothetical protein
MSIPQHAHQRKIQLSPDQCRRIQAHIKISTEKLHGSSDADKRFYLANLPDEGDAIAPQTNAAPPAARPDRAPGAAGGSTNGTPDTVPHRNGTAAAPGYVGTSPAARTEAERYQRWLANHKLKPILPQSPSPPTSPTQKNEPAPEPKQDGAKAKQLDDIQRELGLDTARALYDKNVTAQHGSSHEPTSTPTSKAGKPAKHANAIAAALGGIKTATALQTMMFPPLKYIVPGLIVEGCVILAGKPKAGKSWLAYDVALAAASGRVFLGDKKCEPGDVLVLALEDNDRRMQSRATKLLPTFGGQWPERFNYQTKWPRADQGGIEAIEAWCEAHPEARLVVIDVLARFRAPSTNKSAYEQDYAAVSALQELASRRAITILIVHHTRKGASEDPVEEISGTLGLGGGVDAFLILKKRGLTGTLIGRGRDTEDQDLGLQFSKETCRWTILGEAADVQRSEQRAHVLVALEGADEGLHTTEIVARAGLVKRPAADVLLSTMVIDGQIERVTRGVYGLPGTKSLRLAKITEKDQEYGENPAKHHTPSSNPASNQSKGPGQEYGVSDAIGLLRWALTERRLVRDVEAQARAEGMLGEHQRIDNAKSFRIAKQQLGVVVEREGFGPGSKVYWRLPDNLVPEAPECGSEGDGQ